MKEKTKWPDGDETIDYYKLEKDMELELEKPRLIYKIMRRFYKRIGEDRFVLFYDIKSQNERMTKYLTTIYFDSYFIDYENSKLSTNEIEEIKSEEIANKKDKQVYDWDYSNIAQPPSDFLEFNTPFDVGVNKHRLIHILASCWFNFKSGREFCESFPKNRDSRLFPLKLCEEFWNPKMLLDKIHPELVEKFNEEGIIVGDTKGLKEYYKEGCEAPEVKSEEYVEVLRNCTLQGPFIHEGTNNLEH